MAADEYVLDTPLVQEFVSMVRASIEAAASPEEACSAIRPRFGELLADPAWLPAEFRVSAPESGMGGGIGQWLLFRAGDGSLSLFSLVVPSGSATPVHDHLAWGLVGLTLARARTRLHARHCKVGRVTRRATSGRPGRVLAQRPRAGAVRRAGFRVRLVVGRRTG